MTSAVERHEAELARALGAAHAVAFGHARQALAAVLVAAGLEPEDEVVLSPLTCKVVPLALASAGLVPRYADVDAATLNLSAEAVDPAPEARALLFQHTYGSALGLDAAEELAERRGLVLVEDCAQSMPLAAAVPSAARAARPGSPRAAIFSNNLMKPLPAGSGGVAVTGDAELAAGIRRQREPLAAPGLAADLALAAQAALHAALLFPSTYWPLYALAKRAGSHYAMRSLEDEVRREVREAPGRISARQARAGSRWLGRAAALAEHRAAACAAYTAALADAVELPRTEPGAPLGYLPVLVPEKPALLARARAARVEVVPWPVSTPIYPVEDERELATYGYEVGSCPVAESVARRLVGLPTHGRVGPRALDAVVRLVREHVR